MLKKSNFAVILIAVVFMLGGKTSASDAGDQGTLRYSRSAQASEALEKEALDAFAKEGEPTGAAKALIDFLFSAKGLEIIKKRGMVPCSSLNFSNSAARLLLFDRPAAACLFLAFNGDSVVCHKFWRFRKKPWKPPLASLPQRPQSTILIWFWMPAFAGMTAFLTILRISRF